MITALPMFIWMGEVLYRTRLAEDMFEGLAIYNILREYKGKVTVKILGIAASAASVIAMAGDEIRMGLGAFLMIHNCWVGVAGNRIGLREMADTLEPFDKAMANIYAARTGDDVAAMQTLMDAESWISGGDAVDQGFADSLLDSAELKEGTKASTPQQIAARRLDVDGKGLQIPDVVGDPAGNGAAGSLGERRRPRVQRAVPLRDRHRAPIITRPRSSTMAACVSAGRPSTAGSARRVMPSTAPAATHASSSRRSRPESCRRGRRARRPSAATMP